MHRGNHTIIQLCICPDVEGVLVFWLVQNLPPGYLFVVL